MWPLRDYRLVSLPHMVAAFLSWLERDLFATLRKAMRRKSMVIHANSLLFQTLSEVDEPNSLTKSQ